ncbi:uncharacterized protein [Typha latifolia]|uniref:uncharacterized protein isoform X2 n=1 Tax=Typha latifolia TaxID=4733 RepID=UPI003C30B730
MASKPHSLLLLFLFAASIFTMVISFQGSSGLAAMVMKPAGAPFPGIMVFNETRRKLGSFRICAPCTCCGGPKGLCLLSPCCYAINCNIPNRPFGFCSFTPKACDCLGEEVHTRGMYMWE